MEEGIKKRKKQKQKKEEEEIYRYNNYDERAIIPSDTSKNSSNQQHLLKKSSKETIGLSLEVEIADSLKQLITSPEKHNLSLIDVTIVRPLDLNCMKGIETNLSSLNSSEIRNLIASMERQKQQKKKLIDEYKKHAMEAQERTKHKRRTEKKSHRKNFEVLSAHAKVTRNVDLIQPYTNSASISILKPLMGQIKQSLKNLEERIGEVGDHRPKELKVTTSKVKLPSNSASNESNISEETAKRRRAKKRLQKLRQTCRLRNQHVYATVNNFDKLKTMMKCQNPSKDPDDEKPCLCQHCGMIGLLSDSQKRPIMPSLPVKTSGMMGIQDADSTDTSVVDDHYYVIREMARRLKDLEDRVAIQEQCAVPKEYFKKVIKKMLNIQSSVSQQNIGTTNASGHTSARHCGTQYGVDQIKSRVRQRNVQIQQGYGRKYMINPLEVSEGDAENGEASVGNKAINVITEFFTKLSHDKNEESKSATDTFWKWGEEIIKPGIDLKMKILSLLDEKMEFKSAEIKNKNGSKISLISLEEIVPPPVQQNSSGTMKKMINFMSEKIYHEHVKPTVDAIKEEQLNLKKENTENMFQMKNEMEAAILKINTNQTEVGKIQENKDIYVNKIFSESKSKEGDDDYLHPKTYKPIRSGIPIRVGKTSVDESGLLPTNPKISEAKNSAIPKLVLNQNPSILNSFQSFIEYKKHDLEKPNGKIVDITYMNPKVIAWNEDSLASVPIISTEEVRFSSSASSSQCKIMTKKEQSRKIMKNHSITEKVKFLKSIASSEIIRSQLWSNIWNQARAYCKSKNDTVIIQIPTKLQNKHVGITEVEFTIEDIQHLMKNTENCESGDDALMKNKGPNELDPFLFKPKQRTHAHKWYSEK